ncbi:MAG: prepilin-type N-terminal cleavage/methylation domain-containing protein [Deltaproteobacteria bacterium]|nr:prepilin-type N-terminal cleavage/methylation domain-containing protein [Deltaproteobacteria bacterium]
MRGSLPRFRFSPGFTLIELVAVMAVIGVMFAVVVPRVTGALETRGLDKAARTVSGYVSGLKEDAVASGTPRYLFVDFPTRKIGKAAEPFPEDQPPSHDHPGLDLPAGIRLVDVQFPGGGRISSGLVQLRVSPRGYVRHAAIHLADAEGREMTLILEPFLSRIQVAEGYVSLEK